MAHKPKTYVPLGGNNVARRSSRNGIVIVDQTNNDCIELNQNEVATLRTLITPPVTDKKIDELIHIMFAGLYQFEEIELEPMRQIVRDWLAALNQQPATSH